MEFADEPDQDTVLVTAANVQALAHPIRVQVLGALRTQGPATATLLAAQLGLSSGSLSYHLRQLDRFGFIAEDADRGNSRDRWWRAVHRSTSFDPGAFSNGTADPAVAAAGQDFERSVDAALTASLERARRAASQLPPEWQRSFDVSDVLLRLTAEQATRLGAELLELIRRYPAHAPDAPLGPDERVVEARFQVFPSAPRPPT